MSLRNRKQIVIDANIGRGSSDDKRFNPLIGSLGDHSHQCLQAFWEERHFAVFSKKLRDEWDKHANSYAKSWLSRMTLKSRILNEEGEQFVELLGPACSCLAIDGYRAALAKDFHLVQSALASGQLILSNETKFPHYIGMACDSVPALTQLHYANPQVEGEECKLWIKAGAEKEPRRRIDVWALNYLSDE